VRVAEDLLVGLAGALRGCADWHGTPEIVVRRSDPAELVEPLHAAIEASSLHEQAR
jgi:hypothetical protein